MGLDPAARRLLAMVAAGRPADGSMPDIDGRRRGLAALMRLSQRPPEGVEATDTAVQGGSGAIPARLYRPPDATECPSAGLIYFHGGGLVAGSLETHDALCRTLAAGARCRILAVGYRLAPEHRFPAAVEDACVAAADILARAAAFGLEPGRIAIGGDSAGATLATVAAAALRFRAGPRLACQVLLCPVLDAEARTPSRKAYADGYLLDASLMARDLADYAPGADVADPRLSPLRSPDLSGLPPALIHTAEFDPLRDDGAAYAEALRRSGVRVEYRCHAGMIHHFYGLTSLVPTAAAALAEIADGVSRALGSEPDGT